MTRGAVLLPTIITIGFLMVGVGLAGSVILIALNRSNYNIRLSTAALAAARAGIDDAYLRILRTNYTGNYILSLGERRAEVSVAELNNKYTVNSLGVAGRGLRKLQAILDVDSRTHEVKLQTLNEVEL